MNGDRKRVLSLLAEGKIDANQAERLLDALGSTESGTEDFSAGRASSTEQAERVRVTVEPETEGRDYDDTFSVDGPVRLEVENFDGRVDVTGGGPEDSVRVMAEMRNPSGVDYRLGQNGNTIRVESRRKGKQGTFHFIGINRGAHIKVIVPTNTEVSIQSSNGRISLSKVEGAASLQTSNGRIVIEDVSGNIEAKTSNSRIEATRVVGDSDLHTSNGRINIEESKGTFNVVTENGSIQFDGEFASGGKNQLKTSNGGVRVRLRGEPSLKLLASTTNGSIKCSPSLDDQEMSGKNHLTGILGAGDASLTLQTTNGSISIDAENAISAPVAMSGSPPATTSAPVTLPSVPFAALSGAKHLVGVTKWLFGRAKFSGGDFRMAAGGGMLDGWKFWGSIWHGK